MPQGRPQDYLLNEFGEPITTENMHLDTSRIGRGNPNHQDTVNRVMQQAITQSNPARPSSPLDLPQTVPTQSRPPSMGGMPQGGPPLAGFQLGGQRNQLTGGAIPQTNQVGGGFGQHLGNAIAAGFRGISIPELQDLQAQVKQRQAQTVLAQGQAKMQAFEIQEKMRDQKAMQNVPQFQKAKLPELKKMTQQVIKEKTKINPGYQGSPADIQEAMLKVNQAVPGFFSPVDMDTMFRTNQGKIMTLGMGVLPMEQSVDLIQRQGQLQQNEQMARRQQIQLSTISDLATIMGPRTKQGGFFEPQRFPNQMGEQIAKAMGEQPDLQLARLTGSPIHQTLDSQTGKIVRSEAGPIPASAPILDSQMALQQAMTDVLQGKVKGETTKPEDEIISAEDANKRAQSQLGPMLPDPENFTPFSTPVRLGDAQKQINEMGENYRKAAGESGQNLRLDKRLADSDKKLAQRHQNDVVLENLRFDQQGKKIDKIFDLKKSMQQDAFEYGFQKQENAFTQQERVATMKADRQLEAQRERLQTEAGIKFTSQAIQNDANEAMRFALANEQNFQTSARGILTTLIKKNPGLGLQFLEKMESQGMEKNAFEAARGALQDYQRDKAAQGISGQIDDIIKDASSEGRAIGLLTNKMRQYKEGSPERQHIQSIIAAMEHGKKSGVVEQLLEKLLPSDSPLGKNELTKLNFVVTNGRAAIDMIQSIKAVIDEEVQQRGKAALTGVGGAMERVKNLLAGTVYDLDANYEFFDNKETFNKMFNSNAAALPFLANAISYVIAKTRDPAGRLSDQDFERSRIPTGLGTPQASFEAMVGSAQKEILNSMSTASTFLNMKKIPTAVADTDREDLIQGMANNPNLPATATLEQIRHEIQLALMDSAIIDSPVWPTREALDQMAREVLKRKKAKK